MRYAIKKVSYIYNESKRIKITSFRAALRFDRLTTVLHYLDSTISPRYPHTKISIDLHQNGHIRPKPSNLAPWATRASRKPTSTGTAQLGPLQRGKTTWLCDGRIIDSPLGGSGGLPNGVLWAEVSFFFLMYGDMLMTCREWLWWCDMYSTSIYFDAAHLGSLFAWYGYWNNNHQASWDVVSDIRYTFLIFGWSSTIS